TVERISDQLAQGARVLRVVKQGQVMLGAELVIELGKAPVIVGRLQKRIQVGDARRIASRQTGSAAFRREAHQSFGLINHLQVVDQIGRISWRLGAALSLIVEEEKSLVFHDRAAERAAKLILPQLVGQRRGLQE